MGDIEGRLPACQAVEFLVDLRLRHGIQRTGGFVQNNQRSIFIKCPGYGHLLFLTSGQFRSLLIICLTQKGLHPLGQLLHFPLQTYPGYQVLHLLPVLPGLPAADIFFNGKSKQAKVLEHGCKLCHIRCIVIFCDIPSVYQNTTALWVIQTTQELYQSGLPGAV